MMGLPGGLNAPDPAAVTRFAAALTRLNPGAERIGLAVSGGPDSMAMLLLAQAAVPGGFEVAAVNHGLRPEAALECALVAKVCADRGITCAVLGVELASGNVLREARRARYAALAGWAKQCALAMLATAHHADDQAETLLMRLNRGSGVAGLAGVREAGEVAGMRVIRPMLGFRRAELVQMVAAAGIDPAQDPSNTDPHYDRVRMRQNLAACDWLDPLALAHSAGLLADAETALAAFEDALRPAHVTQSRGGFTLIPPAVPLMRVRMVRRIIAAMGGNPRGGDAARLVERLERGEGGNVGGVLATVKSGEWVFVLEPARRG